MIRHLYNYIHITCETAGIQACLKKPAAAVVVETLRHVVKVRKDLKLGFLDKVENMATANGWASLQGRSRPNNPLDPDCSLEHLM